MEFQTHAPLWRLPEPGRIDIRSSLCNPLQELVVRVYRQKASIPVIALVDLSASMGNPAKLDWVTQFSSVLGRSVKKTGDRFGFFGCSESIIPEFFYPPGKAWHADAVISQRLQHFLPTGRNSQGLLEANFYMPRSSLVFLVYDFYFEKDLLDRVLTSLSRHFIVPVVLDNTGGSDVQQHYGWGYLRDAETGQLRFVVWRPALQRKIEQQKKDHLRWLTKVLLRYGIKPLVIKNRFRTEDLTAYFYPATGPS